MGTSSRLNNPGSVGNKPTKSNIIDITRISVNVGNQKSDGIVQGSDSPVKHVRSKKARTPEGAGDTQKKRGRPPRRTLRRQQHGSAWHWKQTDCWHYTLPGSKKRMPLFDEDGARIRGKDNKDQARLALARVKLAGEWQPEAAQPIAAEEWLVARVCSEYLQYCQRGAASGSLGQSHCDGAKYILNDLCRFCGALPVAQLKKGHIKTWIESHVNWKSPATHRSIIAVVVAAFNYSQDNHDISNPLKGLKRPATRLRLHSISGDDLQTIFRATDEPFRDFLFAALHTGLRPFCELAKVTADDVEETPRGMMWRVYSSKTKKTRKIPVRPEVAELTRKLLPAAPQRSGKPLFRNPQGNPWKRVTGVSRFLGIKRKVGWDADPVRRNYSTYSCRHTFAHRMLSGYWNNGVGCSVEMLAELIGDTPKVAFDHYGGEWGQHFQDPLWNAIGVPHEVAKQRCARQKNVVPRRRVRSTRTHSKGIPGFHGQRRLRADDEVTRGSDH